MGERSRRHLGDGDGLLLHDFVDGGTVDVLHLVELVDAADALIGEHQRPTLQHHLPCRLVLRHCRRQAHPRRPTARRVLACTPSL